MLWYNFCTEREELKMALRGKKPDAIQKRLKMFLYSKAGVGKTTAAISFPNCYLIDCEKGSENTQYVRLLEKSGGVVFHSPDYDEIMQEIRALRTEKHDYKTLIIDPVTIVYQGLIERFSVKKDGSDGTGYGAHYKAANAAIKRMLRLLLNLDMNLILTAHAKNEYEIQGSGQQMTLKGQTFDFMQGSEYIFDLVLEAKKIGNTRTAKVIKTRIETFEDGEIIDFNYDEIATRYGKDVILAEVKPVIVALPEEVAHIKDLVASLQISRDEVRRWFDKVSVDSFEDLPQDVAHKIIDMLKTKAAKGAVNVQ